MLFLKPYIRAFLFYYVTINFAHAQTYEIFDDAEIKPSKSIPSSGSTVGLSTKALGLPNVPVSGKIVILSGVSAVFTTIDECNGAAETTTEKGGSDSDQDTTSTTGSGGSDGSGTKTITEAPGDRIAKSSWNFNDQVFPPDTTQFDNETYWNINGVLLLPDIACSFLTCPPSSKKAVCSVRTIGQSIIWDTIKSKIFFVDKFGQRIIEYSPTTGLAATTIVLGVTLNAILPTIKINRYLVVTDNRIVTIETVFFPSGLVARFKHICVTFDPAWSLGVAKTDMNGRLWIAAKFKTDCENSIIITYIYMINNGTAEVKETTTGVTGGMAWAEKFYFVVDIDAQCIYKYDYERKTGDISNQKIIFDIENNKKLGGVPNDIVLDNKDQLWCTLFLAGKVIQIDSNSGKVLQTIKLSSYYPVSLAFGGLLQNKLFVTTAYGDNPKIMKAETLVICNLEAKGKSATKAINTKKVFGNATINVNFPEAADCESGFVTSKNDITSLRFNCNNNYILWNSSNIFSCGDGSKNCFVQRLHVDVGTYGNSINYDRQDNAFYMADVYGPSVIKRNVLTGYTSVIKLRGVSSVAGIIPIKNKLNKFVATEDQSIVLYENNFLTPVGVSGPYKKVLHTLEPKNCALVFTRAKVDCKGRLWTGAVSGSVIPSTDGKVLVFTKDTKVELNLPEIKKPGGMAWSKNDKRFFLADMTSRIVYSYKFNSETGDISSPREFYVSKIHQVYASDLAVDNDDFIWATMYGNSTVIRINPKTRKVVRTITIPSQYPMSLEFGGIKRDVLYVTTAHGFNCTNNVAANTYAILNLGVSAAMKKTYRFVC